MSKKDLIKLLEEVPDDAVAVIVIPRFDIPRTLVDRTYSWALDDVRVVDGILQLRSPGLPDDFAEAS